MQKEGSRGFIQFTGEQTPEQVKEWMDASDCFVLFSNYETAAVVLEEAAACGLPIAVAGALGFIWFGQQAQITVPNTIGYIHIYAFIGISMMSFFTAKLGAKVAHLLSPAVLKKCFAALLTTVGLYFIYQGFMA